MKFANCGFVNLGRVESGEERWDVVQALRDQVDFFDLR